MEQAMVFKKDFTGVTKNGGRPFRTIELHDPLTLENTTFFLNENLMDNIDTSGIKFKDKVVATFQVGNFNGQPRLDLVGLKKLQ